ncbi:hypothetical protein [Flagellimonas crocea]|uniref:hypothetical protein n=1 Tax=Flagellimonas crocea TaxID=3067311 RepID=UPI00296F7FF3|nr:hypothetical protein [Muricauda sp. DH64]
MAAKKKADFKPILIHEDIKLFRDFQKQMAQYKPLLENLKTEYDKLEMGPFSNKVFKGLLKAGIVEFTKTYEAFIDKELDRGGTTSHQSIRKRIKRGLENDLSGLSSSLDKLKRFEPRYGKYRSVSDRLDIKYISYNDRLMIFWINREDSETLLEERCRTYLENEQEKKAYDSLEKVRKAYMEFMENAKPFRGVGRFDIGELRFLVPMGEDSKDPQINTLQFKQFVNNGKIFAGFDLTTGSRNAKDGVKSILSSQSIIEESLL